VGEISEIRDANVYDSSSRVHNPFLGEIVVWRNTANYYLATKIVGVEVCRKDSGADKLRLGYKIAPNKSVSFAL